MKRSQITLDRVLKALHHESKPASSNELSELCFVSPGHIRKLSIETPEIAITLMKNKNARRRMMLSELAEYVANRGNKTVTQAVSEYGVSLRTYYTALRELNYGAR